MGEAMDMHNVAQPVQHEPIRTPSSSSPAKRLQSFSSGAVIYSPMVMQSTTHGTTATSASVGVSGEDASPISSYAAAEYEEIERKQYELRSAVEQRISTLEHALRQREEELEAVRMQLLKTEEDYKFNYNLIKDRDAALAEAATQVQSLYSELKRHRSDDALTAKRLEESEQQAQRLGQRLREVEEEKERALQQMQGAYELREKQLKEDIHNKGILMEKEKQRLHDEYLRRFKALDDARAELATKGQMLATEVEEGWRQQVNRLEAELRASVDAMDALQREKVENEGRLGETSRALSLLKQEHELLQHRFQSTTASAADQKQKYEQKLAECRATMNHGITTAEDTVRQHVQRVSTLEAECGRLQRELTELQDRLQTTQFQRDEDTRHFINENRRAQEQYDQAAAQIEEQRRNMDETQRQFALRLQQLECDLGIALEAKKEAMCRVREYQDRCDGLQREHLQQHSEVERLRRELQQSREEEKITAARALEVQQLADEKTIAASRDVELAHAELQMQQRRMLDSQERAQAEVARLTRELHASEAARHAVEEQYRLVEDANGHRALIEALRCDKETLERKVLDLERANAAIREQVSSFAIELQNDPAVKTAKEMQHRVRELQEDLLRAREDNDQLRSSLREREEEVSRHRIEVLRLRSTGSVFLEQQNVGVRRHQTSEVACGCLSRGDSDRRKQQQPLCGNKKYRLPSDKPAAHEDDSSDRSSSSNRGRGAGFGGQRVVMGKRLAHKDGTLARKVESLRHRCLQLEQDARGLLRERDNLAKELELTRRDVDALTSEKQSLVDLNSLLKAQLREAYRTALECSQQCRRRQAVAGQPPDPRAEAVETVAVEPPNPGRLLTAGDMPNVAGAPRALSLDSERFAALEEELTAIKAHMLHKHSGCSRTSRHQAVSASPGNQKRLQGKPGKEESHCPGASAAPSSRSASQNKVTVVKRGSGAVRHYGYL
ncbi:hypothetical protein DPX39_100135700 [Trypanosoma brucei equiperdum]|uniref:Uncharacterized protein n=1 Tax=Trypanosoma brucei equiperdum TaxID=630700 RepID=A0A3L6KY66_9TRYP|nr:hypothetical protein DPX39_100135700 [Trypanosoma brucei equiperdum]